MINKHDFFYVYDKAVVDWVESYDFLDAINGTENQVVDKVNVYYRPSNKDFAEGKAIQMQTDMKDLLPRISVIRTGVTFTPERSLGNNKVRRWDIINVEGENRHKQIIVPKAYNLSYQIDIQTKTDAHFLQLSSLILWDLDPDYAIKVNHANAFKEKWAHIYLEGVTDNSELERSANEAEVYRNTIDLTIEGWLFFDKFPESVAPVKVMDIVFIDESVSPEQILDVCRVN